MRELILEEARPKAAIGIESASEAATSSRASQAGRAKDLVPLDAPSNFKLIDSTIKSEAQRKLYKQLMRDAKARNKGLRFDLMRAQAHTQGSESAAVSGGSPRALIDAGE